MYFVVKTMYNVYCCKPEMTGYVISCFCVMLCCLSVMIVVLIDLSKHSGDAIGYSEDILSVHSHALVSLFGTFAEAASSAFFVSSDALCHLLSAASNSTVTTFSF